jgi:hypothetical protein
LAWPFSGSVAVLVTTSVVDQGLRGEAGMPHLHRNKDQVAEGRRSYSKSTSRHDSCMGGSPNASVSAALARAILLLIVPKLASARARDMLIAIAAGRNKERLALVRVESCNRFGDFCRSQRPS